MEKKNQSRTPHSSTRRDTETVATAAATSCGTTTDVAPAPATGHRPTRQINNICHITTNIVPAIRNTRSTRTIRTIRIIRILRNVAATATTASFRTTAGGGVWYFGDVVLATATAATLNVKEEIVITP